MHVVANEFRLSRCIATKRTTAREGNAVVRERVSRRTYFPGNHRRVAARNLQPVGVGLNPTKHIERTFYGYFHVAIRARARVCLAWRRAGWRRAGHLCTSAYQVCGDHE